MNCLKIDTRVDVYYFSDNNYKLIKIIQIQVIESYKFDIFFSDIPLLQFVLWKMVYLHIWYYYCYYLAITHHNFLVINSTKY
jgi:hypothetical protein